MDRRMNDHESRKKHIFVTSLGGTTNLESNSFFLRM